MDKGLQVTCGQKIELSAVFGFIDLNYRDKSVATQISQEASLAPIPYAGEKGDPTGDQSVSTTSKQHSLNV